MISCTPVGYSTGIIAASNACSLWCGSGEGRAAIARDEATGVQSRGEVALALDHREAHEGLGSGEKDTAGGEGVLVLQRDGQCGHYGSSNGYLGTMLQPVAGLCPSQVMM